MKKEDNTDEIINRLLDIPRINLLDRIKKLEEEIGIRNRLSDEAIVSLDTQQFVLEQKIWDLRYALQTERALGIRKDFQIQHQILEEYKIKEKLACFKDVSELESRIQEAREELNKQEQKRKLLRWKEK